MKYCFLVAMAGVIAGCATPYQPSGFTGGYKDKELSAGKYEVYYLGNGVTSLETVTEYWHRRASELCQGKKYQYQYGDSTSVTNETVVAAGSGFVPVSVSYPQLSGTIECQAE